MIFDKCAEVMSTHSHSHTGKQMLKLLECKRQQRLYYNRYQQLLNKVKKANSKLDNLNRVPDNKVKPVRDVGTYVDMPTKSKRSL